MTIGEVIEMIKAIFALLAEYLAPLFSKDEEEGDEAAEG